jgi:hypothetical protein
MAEDSTDFMDQMRLYGPAYDAQYPTYQLRYNSTFKRGPAPRTRMGARPGYASSPEPKTFRSSWAASP